MTQSKQQDLTHALPYILAYPALLAGHQTVHEAINDHLLSSYLTAFLEQGGLTNGSGLDHFFAPATNGPLTQLCADGVPELPTYILPVLLDRLARNSDVHRLAFLLATYSHYLAGHPDRENGPHSLEKSTTDDRAKISPDDVVALPGISATATARLQTYAHFMAMYRSYRNQIAGHGVEFLLRQMAYNQLAMQLA